MISGVKGVFNTQGPFIKQNDGQNVRGVSDRPEKRNPQHPIDEVLKESDRAKRLNAITAKLDAGKKLSRTELDFLRENDVDKYRIAMQVQIDREIYEKKMSECKSQDEVRALNDLHTQMSAAEMRSARYDTQISAAKWRNMSYKDAYEEFVQTDEFRMMRQSR